ncbi:MAG: iron-sulfur cluster-binding domain-containing protein [Devosia sp.]
MTACSRSCFPKTNASASALLKAGRVEPDERDVVMSCHARGQISELRLCHTDAAAQVGGSQRTGLPRNSFALLPAPSHLFLAGGIGITQILPMLRSATNLGADRRLAYGGRSLADMAFTTVIVSDMARTTLHAQDEVGLLPIDQLVAACGPRTLIYACGPQPMLDAIRRAAEHHGVNDRLHVEGFAALTSSVADVAFTVYLARSGKTLTVPADATVVQVLEGHGIGVHCLCTEGYCGTCETAVLDGIPDHRDTVLSAAEKARNTKMMICVGRSRTAHLTLDI